MYNKPVILTNDDLAEGVYAASGDPASSGFSYTLNQTGFWDGHKQYNISLFNNTDAPVFRIVVTLKVHGNVTSVGGNVSGVIKGDTAEITFNAYDQTNGIQAHSSVNGIYMEIAGTGEFSLE